MFVEAARAVPRTDRRPIMGFQSASQFNLLLSHPGLPEPNDGIYPADLRVLESLGLLSVQNLGHGSVGIEVLPSGFDEYERIHRETGLSAERIEEHARRFVDS